MIRDDMLKRLDELMAEVVAVGHAGALPWVPWSERWLELRTKLQNEHCETCACWDSDPSSAPDVKIPEKSHARVCFDLTLQDWRSGEFQAEGAVATHGTFCCSHFAPKESKP